MNGESTIMSFNVKRVAALEALLLMALLSVSVVVMAAVRSDDDRLLDEAEYKSGIEEVIVVGKQPEWRQPANDQQVWRPDKFKLPEQTQESRIEWFPRYTEDERDQYDGARDRMDAKPAIKLFEWKF